MSTKNQSTNRLVLTIVKIVVFALCIYLAFLILRPLLAIILGIGFWIIKVAVIIAVCLLVVHILLRLIFKIDLVSLIFGVRWPK